MNGVRIEPIDGSKVFLVDVVCDCGHNGLFNEATGERSFKHRIEVGATSEQKILVRCDCGKKYVITAQRTHVHIVSMG